jgi:hypothetical protein
LPKIHDRICEKLETLGRKSWAEEEFEKFHQPETYQKDGRKRLRKLKGVGSLPRRGLAIAEALLDVRDELARQYDRPRGAVLKDYLLMELVQRGWTDAQKIKSLRGLNLNDAAIGRLAEAVEQAKTLPLEACPEPLGGSPDTPEEEVASVLIQAVLRDYCVQNRLAYSLLATSRQIQATVRAYLRGEKDPASTPLMSGWRGQTIGKLVEGLLTGKSSIRLVGQVGQRHFEVEVSSRLRAFGVLRFSQYLVRPGWGSPLVECVSPEVDLANHRSRWRGDRPAGATPPPCHPVRFAISAHGKHGRTFCSGPFCLPIRTGDDTPSDTFHTAIRFGPSKPFPPPAIDSPTTVSRIKGEGRSSPRFQPVMGK